MKLKYIFFTFLFSYYTNIFSQVVGTPTLFEEENNKLELVINYSLARASEQNYVYTLFPLLNNQLFQGEVIWSSSNESIATINKNGEVTLVDESASDGVTFKAEIKDGHYKGLNAELFNPFKSKAQGTELSKPTSGQIFVNKQLEQGTIQPIKLVLFPTGNKDVNTFKTPSLYTISDETIATINDGKIKVIKPGMVTITGTSSVYSNITASIEIEVLPKVDKTKPNISIKNYDGNGFIKMQQSPSNVIPTATAEDVIDGTLPVTVTETGTPFNGNSPGEYPVSYYTKDPASNEAKIDLIVKVVDTIAPTLSLQDKNLAFDDVITAKQGEGLTIPVATAVDDNGNTINVTVNDGGFNSDVIGKYKITYKATDASQNTEERSINLEIIVGNPPTITIAGYDDGDIVKVNQNQQYTIPRATSLDARNNQVNVTVEGKTDIDITKAGDYMIKYKATDRFNLSTQKQLTVRVIDTEIPVITNEKDFKLVKRILTTTPSIVAKVEAKDNVGVVKYIMQGIFRPDNPIEDNAWTTYLEGSISIDNDGTIRATLPVGNDFQPGYKYYFKIQAVDAAGNKSAVSYFSIAHFDEKEPNIGVKEYEKATYTQVISNRSTKDFKHQITKQENYKVNDTIAILNADLLEYEFTRFEILGADWANFEFSDITKNTLYIKLKNPFDINVKTDHELTINAYGKLNPTDPERKYSIKLFVHVARFEELSPEIATVKNEITNATNIPVDPLTGNKKFTLNNVIKANGGIVPNANVLGEALLAFNEDLLKLIILGSQQDPKKAGKFSPYFVWIKREGFLVRFFVKFQKGAVAAEIELIIDRTASDRKVYCMVNIGSSKTGAGIQPSRTIHSSLKFLDHMEGNIVFTNTAVTKAEFKCLKLVTNDVLPAGIHLVAKGPLQPLPMPVNPFTNPLVEARIGVTERGWTKPDLTVKFGLDGRFLTDFDKEIVKYLFSASDVAKKGIQEATKKVADAKNAVKDAEIVFDKAKYPVKRAKDALKYVTVPGYKAARYRLGSFMNSKNIYAGKRNYYLRKRVCGKFCIPYIFPKFCRRFRIPYPCGTRTGKKCMNICIPPPDAIVKAAYYASLVASYEALIISAKATLAGLEASLKVARTALEKALRGVEEALEQAKISLDAAKLALAGLEKALVVTEAGYGELGKLARYILDKLPRLAESSNVSFETTLSVANSGTIKGKLGFQFKFKGASPVGKNIDFNFSDPVGSSVNFAKSLVQ